VAAVPWLRCDARGQCQWPAAARLSSRTRAAAPRCSSGPEIPHLPLSLTLLFSSATTQTPPPRPPPPPPPHPHAPRFLSFRQREGAPPRIPAPAARAAQHTKAKRPRPAQCTSTLLRCSGDVLAAVPIPSTRDATRRAAAAVQPHQRGVGVRAPSAPPLTLMLRVGGRRPWHARCCQRNLNARSGPRRCLLVKLHATAAAAAASRAGKLSGKLKPLPLVAEL
jgi:hypothetical protein